jgi:hypothetical protein
MNPEDLNQPLSTDFRLQLWATSPEFTRVSLAARALWLLIAMRPHPMTRLDIVAVAGLNSLETGKLIAELMDAQLVEMHGHVILNPSFSIIPRPGMPFIADPKPEQQAPAPLPTSYP